MIPAVQIPPTDEAILAALQRQTYRYFTDNFDPRTGLTSDKSEPGSLASIAAVGLGLTTNLVAVERGYLSRSEACTRTLTTLRFFATSPQGPEPDATGYNGFYYHFLDMQSGRRVWKCELSLIDSALLLAGVLLVGCYFDGNGEEAEIRSLADQLYRRVDWNWAQNGGSTVTQGWKPECGFLHYGWEGYNEATILYALGLGSPTFPLPAQSFTGWTTTYQFENLLDQNVLYSGPLFTHLFSHAWVDFAGIQDKFMRDMESDYSENTKRTIALHREYAARNPRGYAGYCRNFWGVTAGEGPGTQELRENGRDRRFFGYTSRGAPYGPDDGTIAPWAMLATLPFAPGPAIEGTRHLLKTYPEVFNDGRFSSGFNPSLVKGDRAWISDGWFGLDQGLLVLMIENYRTRFVWEIMRECPYLRVGLQRAGFRGGWL